MAETGGILIMLPVLALLLGASAFFSGTETAFFSLSREQLLGLSRRKGARAKAVADLAARPGALLTAILFGNMLVNVLFFCCSTVVAMRLGSHYGLWVRGTFALGMLVALILFGEVLPKAYGVTHPEPFSCFFALPMEWWVQVCRPLIRACDVLQGRFGAGEEARLTQDELKMLLKTASAVNQEEVHEREIIEDIVCLPETRVRELMTPRVDLLTASADADPAEVMRRAAEREVSYVPVYEGEQDNLIGAVHVRELYLQGAAGLRSFVRPLFYVPETARADRVLQDMIGKRTGPALVLDEYGGLAGIVTLDDLMQETAARPEEKDVAEMEEIASGCFRVSGRLPIREWREMMRGHAALIPEQLVADTLGGLVIAAAGHLPEPGESVSFGNLRMIVERVRNHRIESVLLELQDVKGGAS